MLLEAACVVASIYWEGKLTANGEHFRPDGLTVAHKTLPFGTLVQFTLGPRSVVARVNDRGPFIKGREFDLSRGTARALGRSDGLPCVHYRVVGMSTPLASTPRPVVR